MLKKVLTLILAGLLAVALAAGTAWAEPGKGNGPAGAPGKSGIKVEKQVDNGKAWAQTRDMEAKPGNGPKSDKIKVYREKYKNMIKSESVVGGIKFKDLKNDHWAKDSIQRMSALGLFSGYSDGTFKPNNNISQAELAVLVMRLVEVTGVDEDDVDEETGEEETVEEEEETDGDVDEEENTEDEEETGEDVDEEENGDEDTEEEATEEEEENEDADDEEGELEDVPAWAREQVKNAAKMGFINMNRFHSHVQASRAQTAVIIAKAMGLEPVDTTDMPFVDGVLISAEDVGYILALYEEGLIKGMPGGKFNPNSAITRAEMAALIERILAEEEENGEEEQTEEETTETDENDAEDGEDEEQDEENDGETSEEDDETGENTEQDGEQ